MYKTCTKCGAEKPHAEFSKHKRAKDGLQPYCKACDNEHNKKWREDNRERMLERSKKWNEENKERKRESDKKWREDNKEHVREYTKKWAKDNPHIGRAKAQRRRARKKAALPYLSENDNLALKLLSEEASILGEGWHLDHIVPLSKGGLHHPDNLQIVRGSYNLSKKDKLWQDRKYV
jgi:HNH endonuclease.